MVESNEVLNPIKWRARIAKGDIIVLASFGAGFQWGSVVIKW